MSKDNISFKLLNEIFLSISQLAERVPLGGEDYVRMVCEFYTERVFSELKENFNPSSNEAIDLCRALIEIMDQAGIITKADYKFSSEGDLVNITVNKSNCTYYEYCRTAKEKNLPTACCRMISCRWIAGNFTGRQYQLRTEYIADSNRCQGSIYPGERISQILSKDGDNISIAGERALILSTNAFGILMKTIYDYAPHLLEQVLFESTYYSSLVEYDNVKSYYPDSHELINYLLSTANRLGNIRYEIIEFDALKKTAVIRGYGSYIAEIFKENTLFSSPKASCASARGRLSAYFTRAWGEEIVCEEMKCEAFGDDYCEFILLPEQA